MDPERIAEIAAKRKAVIEFTEEWADELTEPEKALFEGLLDQLDAAVSKPGNSAIGRRSLDSLQSSVDRNLELVSHWRYIDAVTGNLLGWEARYLPEENRRELERLNRDVSQAREAGEWERAERVADEARGSLERPGRIGPPDNIPRSLVQHRRLSMSLSHRVTGALNAIDDGIQSGSQARFDQGTETLNGLWEEIDEELAGRDDRTLITTKPRDWQGA